jgi:hypothetical protein
MYVSMLTLAEVNALLRLPPAARDREEQEPRMPARRDAER